MIYIESWGEKTYTIAELQVGDIFTDYCNRSPRGAYLFTGHDQTTADENSVAYHMPYKALDIMRIDRKEEGNPAMRFGEVFVRKGVLTKEGTALAAGLLASGV